MKPLGEILLERGWITDQQLSEAFSRQAALGSRLGTCLLELGAIREDLMLKVLSEQLEVPFAEIEDLRNVDVEVREMLAAGLAIQHSAVPFQATTSSVDIALLEVKNLALHDELSFVMGKKLNIHIANEARIFEALEKYYGKPCPIRFTHLIERLNRERDRWKEPHRAAGEHLNGSTKPDTAPISKLPVQAIHRPRAGTKKAHRVAIPQPKLVRSVRKTIPVSDHELFRLGTDRPDESAKASVISPADLYDRDLSGTFSVEDVEARLEQAASTEEVGQTLLGWLSQEFVRGLLFKVGNGQVKGWLGAGRGLDEERFRDYRVSLDEPSIFLNLKQGGSFFLGKLPPMEPHVRLAECWHEDLAHECTLFPIRLGDRLVSLFYGDRDCLGLDGLELPVLQRLANKTADAFEMCIRQKKRQKSRKN